jgi:hypothetical protein
MAAGNGVSVTSYVIDGYCYKSIQAEIAAPTLQYHNPHRLGLLPLRGSTPRKAIFLPVIRQVINIQQ